jgi:hypothetical protein
METYHHEDHDDPGALCDKCSVPLPEPRTEYCNLGAGCCQDCMAECEKEGKCAKVSDPAVWGKIEHLRRLVHDPANREGHK